MGKQSRELVAVSKVPTLLDEIKTLNQQIDLKNKQIDDLKRPPTEVSLNDLSIFYHNVATKELVVNNQKNLITKPVDQKPFIEWKDLTPEQKTGRMIMMDCLLKEYRIVKR